MDQSESSELLLFATENNNAGDFDPSSLFSEPIAEERDFTTRSQDTFDSFGDFADDIDIDLSDDDLSLHHHSVTGAMDAFSTDRSPSPSSPPRIIQQPTTIIMPDSFLASADQQIHLHSNSNSNLNDHRTRQIPARAVSYSEGDQRHLLLQMQEQNFLQMHQQQQQQQQLMLQNSLSSLQNASFHDTTAEQNIFSQQQMSQQQQQQQQQQMQLPQGMPNTSLQGMMQNPASLNDAMEKLCETMKRSAVTRNLVKQLSGRNVTRSNSTLGLMRTSSSKGSSSIGDMARMAPIRKPSMSKHSIKRGVMRQTSQQSLDGSNHLLQVDGRSVGHF